MFLKKQAAPPVGKDEISISRVTTAHDKDSVRQLLYTEYFQQGYIPASQSYSQELFPFLDNPNTTTFATYHQGTLYGSMSLVTDSAAGFPMDAVFKPELDELRREGLKLAEDCYMVVSAEKRRYLRQQRRDRETLMLLFRAVVASAKDGSVDVLCGETNPKHELIYTALGFESIGSPRPNPWVNGAPAIGKILDLRRLPELKAKYPVLRFVLNS